MNTKLKEIARKAQMEPKLVFTSLCHHVTQGLIWENLQHIGTHSSPGTDGISVKEAKETFQDWIKPMLQSVHQKGYKAPTMRRCWIPKPGKKEKRPLGVPCVGDRALQRSVSTALTSIYEQDFLSCSFGGRPKLSAHNALSTLNEIIAGKKVGWVYEADLKNFFGSLNHEWMVKFIELRIGDPRIISLIKKWLKVGIVENGIIHLSDRGTHQGGSISVLLSNMYLHYVLDLWFEKIVKPRLNGEAYLIRYIDDFVVCFQYRADAIRFQNVLIKRLRKFSLTLEPNKTQLVEFGRFAQKHAKKRGIKVETIYFLGFTHFCTRNSKGNFMVGRKTEKTRYKRSISKLYALLREIRHYSIEDQVKEINQVLRGHYAYYGLGGNYKSLLKVYKIIRKYWRKMLCSRSWKSYLTWDKFQKLESKYPIQRPKLSIRYKRMQVMAIIM